MLSQHSRENLEIKLQKKLGFWMAVSLVMGNMIGSGIFLLPAALGQYGSISLVGWLFATFGALLLAVVFSRLASESELLRKPNDPHRFGNPDQSAVDAR